MPLDITEQNRRPLPFRQPRHGLKDPLQFVVETVRRRIAPHVVRDRSIRRLTARLTDRQPRGDPRNPRAERSRCVQRGQTAECEQKCFLRHVLRRMPVTQNAPRRAQDKPFMAADEFGERRAIALPRQRHQLFRRRHERSLSGTFRLAFRQ